MMLRSFYPPLLSCSLFSLAVEPIVVQLTPPRLESGAILLEAFCDRPRRPSGVNISLEERDNKCIVHCYGHGGFGFTTLFGSVQEAIALLLEQNPSKELSIRVIGSGCMGLTMAIELYRYGFENITISTKEKYNIPSWRAGGLFDPGVGNESTEVDIHRLNLGIATYEVLRSIELGAHPYLTSNVVKRLPIYCPADMNLGVEILEELHYMPRRELVTLDFGNGVLHKNYKQQFTYFIDVTELMKQLWSYVEQLPIKVVNEEITSFAECDELIICNCTGLGSYALQNDTGLVPTRGHFFMLKAESEQTLDYMLFTTVMQNGKKEMIYFSPKPTYKFSEREPISCAGILGGTFIPRPFGESEVENSDEIQFANLAERTHIFFYGQSFVNEGGQLESV